MILEARARRAERDEPAHLEGRKLTRTEGDPGLALVIEMEQVRRVLVIAGTEGAQRNLHLETLPRAIIGAPGVALDTAAHEIFLEYLFESHPHAFRVVNDIDDHFPSSKLGIAGEKSASAAASL